MVVVADNVQYVLLLTCSAVLRMALSSDLVWDLHVAASKGNLQEVQRLLASEPELLESAGSNSLSLALSDGHVEVVRHLLDHGASFYWGGASPLYEAINRGHAHVVQLLLERGADCLWQWRTSSPLHEAALMGRRGVMEVLLRHSTENIDRRDGQGELRWISAASAETLRWFECCSRQGPIPPGFVPPSMPLWRL